MSKSVLISIRPEWCELIASKKKTLEVRKTRPKLETPFKCHIYQSKYSWAFPLLRSLGMDDLADLLAISSGKVIGEFTCDSIKGFDVPYPAFQGEMDNTILAESCLTYYQLHRYAYHDTLYGWHISDLKIYDEPNDLTAFKRPCTTEQPCALCRHAELHPDGMLMCENRVFSPPQSWCYVEEVTDDA